MRLGGGARTKPRLKRRKIPLNMNRSVYEDRCHVFRRFVEMVNNNKETNVEKKADLGAVHVFLQILHHFETHNRKVKEYNHPFPDDVFNFHVLLSPNSKCCLIQPQLIEDRMVLFVYANKTGGFKIKKSQGSRREMFVFQLDSDSSCELQINERIKKCPELASVPVEFFDFNSVHTEPMVGTFIPSLVFCIYVFLRLVEGQFTASSIKIHLMYTDFKSITNHVVSRLVHFLDPDLIDEPESKRKKRK